MQHDRGGRTGGQMLIAAGLLTVLNNVLPGHEHLDVVLLNLLALVAVALGAACLVVRWERLPPWSTLVVAVVAMALLSAGDMYGGVSAYSYAIYYVVIFVWIGLSHPPLTSLWLVPFAVVAYLLPFLLVRPAPSAAVSSVLVAIPVCVLVAEVLARAVARWSAASAHEAAIVDVVADGVVVLDAEGRVRSCNEVAAGILGRPRDEVVGQSLELPAGHLGEVLVTTLAGRRVETVRTALPGSGETVLTVRDVSRQAALDEAKDLFLATTSHELRTPLTAIKGYVHVLRHRWDELDDPRRLEALATVAERTDSLVALTDHLLLGVRAGAARHSASNRPFSLTTALRQAVESLSLPDGHELAVDLGEEPLLALGDPTSVRHVVSQLVENAVKFSPDGGMVSVRLSAEGSRACVEVGDRGIGLPPTTTEQLFTPFFQADAGDTRRYGGVGLGLYIVRELVEAQGGTVTAEPREGGGAVVGFTLPRSGAGATPVPRRAGDDVLPEPLR